MDFSEEGWSIQQPKCYEYTNQNNVGCLGYLTPNLVYTCIYKNIYDL